MKNNFKISTVLIALDYNKSAQIIAETGFSLAKALKAKVILLHILDNYSFYTSTMYDPIMGFSGFNDFDSSTPDLKSKLTESSLSFLTKSKEHLGDDSITTIVREGEYAETILETAQEMKCNLIVIGTHKYHWLEKILVKSTSEEVLSKTNIPLLIIPSKD